MGVVASPVARAPIGVHSAAMLRAVSLLLASAFAIYVLLCAAVAIWQRKLIYFPDPRVVATPLAVGLDYEDVRLETVDGLALAAWWIPRDGACGTALVLHGNGGNRASSLSLVASLHARGFAVLLPDYRGYGGNPGSPSEEGLLRDARAAWDHLVHARGVDAGDVLLHGHSLGGAVAIALATRVRPGAIVVENAFTSLPELGADVYPWLPVRWLTRDRWDNIARLEHVDAPLLVAHATGDEMIGVEHARRLAERAGTNAVLFGGTHDSSLLLIDRADALDEFLARHFDAPDAATAAAGGAR